MIGIMRKGMFTILILLLACLVLLSVSTRFELSSLKSDYSSLVAEHRHLRSEYNKLTSHLSELNLEYHVLSNNYSQLLENVKELGEAYRALNQSFESRYHALEVRHHNLQREYASLKEDLSRMSMNLSELSMAWRKYPRPTSWSLVLMPGVRSFENVVEDFDGYIYAVTSGVREGYTPRNMRGTPGRIYRSIDQSKWVMIVDEHSPPAKEGIYMNSFVVSWDNELWAGTLEGNLYKSRDRGETWERVWRIPDGLQIRAIHYAFNGYLYVTTHNPGRIYRSTNGGATFSKVYETNSNFYAIVSAPNGYLYAGGQKIILRSTDEGASWETVYSAPDGRYWTTINDIAVAPNGYIYAVTGEALYPEPENRSLGAYVLRSTDDGASFHVVWDAPDFALVNVAVSLNGVVYVGTEARYDPIKEVARLYASYDDGVTWRVVFYDPEAAPLSRCITITRSGQIFWGTLGEGHRMSGRLWQGTLL